MGGGGDIFKSVADALTGGLAGSLGGWADGPDGPKGLPSDGPQGPKTYTPEELKATRAGIGNYKAPAFLGLSSAMTPLQQRTAIATKGTSGDSSAIDPEVLRYYRNIALKTLMDDQGVFAPVTDITDIEKQYLKQAGLNPGNTTQSFLSALERAMS